MKQPPRTAQGRGGAPVVGQRELGEHLRRVLCGALHCAHARCLLAAVVLQQRVVHHLRTHAGEGLLEVHRQQITLQLSRDAPAAAHRMAGMHVSQQIQATSRLTWVDVHGSSASNHCKVFFQHTPPVSNHHHVIFWFPKKGKRHSTLLNIHHNRPLSSLYLGIPLLSYTALKFSKDQD